MKNEIINHLPPSHPWKNLIQVHDCLESTNTYAKELAKQGAPEGTAVIALRQTAGRGRLGRSFHSPMGKGLYLSLVLRPHCPPAQLMHLTCAVGVAVCDAIEQNLQLRPGIKWINDLTIDSKKLGGILTELTFTPSGMTDYAVIGIGINCTHSTEDFPEELRDLACSLGQFREAPDLSRLGAALMVSLEEMSRSLLSDSTGTMERYRKDCITLDKQVRVIGSDVTRQGFAETVNNDGSLTVLFPDGHREQVHCGEVSVRGLWDYI